MHQNKINSAIKSHATMRSQRTQRRKGLLTGTLTSVAAKATDREDEDSALVDLVHERDSDQQKWVRRRAWNPEVVTRTREKLQHGGTPPVFLLGLIEKWLGRAKEKRRGKMGWLGS